MFRAMGISRALAVLFVLVVVQESSGTSISCSSQAECEYYIEGSECVDDQCSCPSETVLSSNAIKCLTKADSYDAACTEGVQCSSRLNAGGDCINGKCACSDGYHYLQGVCWKSVPLNGDCFRDEQCYAAYESIGFTCQDSKCKCRGEYYERGGACRRKAVADGSCIVNEDCFCGDGIQGVCDTRKCVCSGAPPAYTIKKTIQPSSEREILPYAVSCELGYYLKNEACVRELGTECSANEECTAGVSSTTCVDNRACGCTGPLMVGAINNRACAKAITAATTPCSSDPMCATFGSYGVCDLTAKLCSCKTGSHFNSGSILCLKDRLLGDTCEIDAECVTTSGSNVACSAGQCSCVQGSHPAGNELDCRTDALMGDSCVEDTDCLFSDAKCDSTAKTCRCIDAYFDDNGVCTAGVGSPCVDNNQCSQLPNTACSADSSLCLCGEGFVPSDDFRTCLNVVSEGDECVQTSQCDPSMGDLKECNKDGKCGCVEGSQYLLGQCFKIIQLGEKCQRRGECVAPGGDPEAYICQNGMCTCQYDYHKEPPYCVPDA